MNKKLTLSLDNSVIKKAKDYAQSKKKSLSQMVENYFKFITSETQNEENEIEPIVEELTGSIKTRDNFDYKDVKFNYLKDKYLND